MYHASKTTEWGKRKKKHEIFSKFIDTKSWKQYPEGVTLNNTSINNVFAFLSLVFLWRQR
jgi:hypothetical protein